MPEGDPARLRRRRATFDAGRWAEGIAAVALVVKGYRILDRRYVVRGGEIDIIARRGRVIVFVEVKARPLRSDALLAVTAQKRSRLGKAAGVWLARNAWAAAFTLRGDAMLVSPRRWPVHVPDAFALRIG